jgi:hypothetical protein
MLLLSAFGVGVNTLSEDLCCHRKQFPRRPLPAFVPCAALSASLHNSELVTRHINHSCFFTCRVTNAPSPQPAAGADIPITAAVLPKAGGDVQTVTLIYRVNYGPEQQVPMVPGPGGACT